MLFTFNKKFRFDRTPTAIRQAQLEHLRNCMSKYPIKKEGIVDAGKLKSKTRAYVTEKSELFPLFFPLQSIPGNCQIFSDNGSSCAEQGQSGVEDLGFQHLIYYPAYVGQLLSPNDNDINGCTENACRSTPGKFDDDVDSSLHIQQLLDRMSTNKFKLLFQTNLLLF
jgi:hypothetical protein